jgi:DNA invertase Pin-like site-specific DNA recombinase
MKFHAMLFSEVIRKMKIGYARVSTTDQNLSVQIDGLEKEKCEKIYKEKLSGARKDRPELQKALEELRKGDTLVVWKLDRLGRTVKQLLNLIEDLKGKGIHFKSIKDKIDTTTPTGTFFFHVMASFAQLERELTLERTMAGLAAARGRGRYGGRPLIHKTDKKEMAYEMYMKNDKTVKEIADALDMGRVTIYRYIKKRELENVA